MELAKIVKTKSLKATLRAMPVGREQVIPSRLWAVGDVRKRACELKREGLLFSVSSKGVVDTFVTRLK